MTGPSAIPPRDRFSFGKRIAQRSRRSRGGTIARVFGECLALSVFVCAPLWADVVTLKNGKELRGLVVERHADRIIFSTVKGEIPILLSGVKKIDYDDPALSYLSVGKEYEEKNRLGEALAYYEKAAEINPGLDEAKRRAQSVRNRFWTQSSAKPLDEIAKRQTLYDLWESGPESAGGEDAARKAGVRQSDALRAGLGLELDKKADWVYAAGVQQKKDAWLAGVRRKDRLVAIDGNSLRYLGVAAVERMLLEPAHTACQLDYERNISLTGGNEPGKLGFRLKMGERGLEVERVTEDGPAAFAGLADQDLVTAVNGQVTRYLSLGKAKKIMKDSAGAVALTVRRSAIFTRK